MPMVDVALAAGFGSVRRFNETFRRLFSRPPSALRRRSAPRGRPGRAGGHAAPALPAAVRLGRDARVPGGARDRRRRGGRGRRLPPHDRARGTPAARSRSRTSPRGTNLAATIRFPCVRGAAGDRRARAARVRPRRRHRDDRRAPRRATRSWRPLVAQRPGLRVPGAWDGFELAVRAILGQQVTVVAARKLAGQLVAALRRDALPGAPAELSRDVPVAGSGVAAADLARARHAARARAALAALAEAAAADPQPVPPVRRRSRRRSRACARIRGIGEWTAQYIAHARAARDRRVSGERHRPAARRRRRRRARGRRRPRCCGARSRGVRGAPTPPSTSGRALPEEAHVSTSGQRGGVPPPAPGRPPGPARTSGTRERAARREPGRAGDRDHQRRRRLVARLRRRRPACRCRCSRRSVERSRA